MAVFDCSGQFLLLTMLRNEKNCMRKELLDYFGKLMPYSVKHLLHKLNILEDCLCSSG